MRWATRRATSLNQTILPMTLWNSILQSKDHLKQPLSWSNSQPSRPLYLRPLQNHPRNHPPVDSLPGYAIYSPNRSHYWKKNQIQLKSRKLTLAIVAAIQDSIEGGRTVAARKAVLMLIKVQELPIPIIPGAKTDRPGAAHNLIATADPVMIEKQRTRETVNPPTQIGPQALRQVKSPVLSRKARRGRRANATMSSRLPLVS